MNNYSIYNRYSTEKRDIKRILYCTDMDKYGYFYGVMEILPFSIPLTEREIEVEEVSDLVETIMTPEQCSVIINEKTTEIEFYNIDISHTEVTYIPGTSIYIMKVFFRATKEE